ncbi:probable mediator of RNA polymerase II transcription subunit 37c [Tanacetum coccineum]
MKPRSSIECSRVVYPQRGCTGESIQSEDLSLKEGNDLRVQEVKGVVKVIVCFEIDADGILNVSAREITTGRHNSVKITNNGSLSTVDIEKMIEDANRYKLEDEAYMKKVIAHRALDEYIYKLKAKFKDYEVQLRLRMLGFSVEDLEAIEHQIEGMTEWLDENCDAEVDELENKEMELDDICSGEIMFMYCSATLFVKVSFKAIPMS